MIALRSERQIPAAAFSRQGQNSPVAAVLSLCRLGMVWCKCLGGRTWSSLQLTMPPRLTQWREATKHLQALRDTLKERAMQIRRAVMGAAVEKGCVAIMVGSELRGQQLPAIIIHDKQW
eukprot:scaffold41981_cov20-Tisochrysis_lutea.AAC.2